MQRVFIISINRVWGCDNMWLVGITEPRLSVNTKFHLFDFMKRVIITVDMRTFVNIKSRITNVEVGKHLKLLNGDIVNLPVFYNNINIKNPNMTILYASTNRGIVMGYTVMKGDGSIDSCSVGEVKTAMQSGVKFVNAQLSNNKIIPMVRDFGFVVTDCIGYGGFSYDLDYLLRIVIEQAKSIGIPISTNISGIVNIINGTLAQGHCEQDNGWYRISINRKYINHSVKEILNIFAHDIIHTCSGCSMHNDRFKHYATLMHKTYGYTMERCQDSNSKVNNNIVSYLRCRKCGHIARYNTETNNISSIICQCCKRVGVLYKS